MLRKTVGVILVSIPVLCMAAGLASILYLIPVPMLILLGVGACGVVGSLLLED